MIGGEFADRLVMALFVAGLLIRTLAAFAAPATAAPAAAPAAPAAAFARLAVLAAAFAVRGLEAFRVERIALGRIDLAALVGIGFGPGLGFGLVLEALFDDRLFLFDQRGRGEIGLLRQHHLGLLDRHHLFAAVDAEAGLSADLLVGIDGQA